MDILEKFNRNFTAEQVEEAINSADRNSNLTQENIKFAFSTIDLTSLNSNDTENKIVEMVTKVNNFAQAFPDMPNVAAICVYPSFVETVKKTLTAKNINIASVTGNFPSSQTFLELKTKETELCINHGADEVDMVISIGKFLSEDYKAIHHEVAKQKEAAGKGHLKVILETGLLKDYDLIYKASMLAMDAGADFIKTSTGKEKVGATPEAVYVMSCAIKDYYQSTDRKVGLKPAGGIATPEIAMLYINIIQQVLGNEWLNNKLFRIGTSSLANKLLTAYSEKTIKYF